MAAELTRELSSFYVEAETHGVGAIFIPTLGFSSQLGRSMIGGALPQADGFQVMGSGSVVIAYLFGMSLIESSTARRWWAMYDVGVLGQELGNTHYGQRQFICKIG